MAVTLIAMKTYAAFQTSSIAMLGSLADSSLDLGASLIVLLAVRIAAQPADHDHRFGHGKAEALAALVQIILISFSALFIAFRATQRLLSGARTGEAELGIAVSIVAIVLTMALITYQRHVVKRTGSLAIGTDRLHYSSDLALNGSVILALALEQYAGLTGADAIFGVLIGLWLRWGAWSASSQALNQLMDREWPQDLRERFLAATKDYPELAGLHDLRTRSSGAHDFAQFHIWVDPNMTVAEAHDVAEAIEADLEQAFPGCEVLIHLDPEGHVDHPGNALLETDETREPIPE
jgi:ferrous-iron efflux pump FieF